jgi:hypothetical protein
MGGMYVGRVPSFPYGDGRFVGVEYAQHSPSWIKAGHVAIRGLLECTTGAALQGGVLAELFADRWVPLPTER